MRKYLNKGDGYSTTTRTNWHVLYYPPAYRYYKIRFSIEKVFYWTMPPDLVMHYKKSRMVDLMHRYKNRTEFALKYRVSWTEYMSGKVQYKYNRHPRSRI